MTAGNGESLGKSAVRTTYPKSYVIERIDARLASMQSEDERGLVAITTFQQFEQRRGRDYVSSVVSALEPERLAGRVRQVVNDGGETAAEIDWLTTASKVSKVVTEGLPTWNESPYRRLDDTGREGLKDAAWVADQAAKRNARERAALEHARAYLEGTPVDEFTLTALKSLGLLDVIKFNLNRGEAL